MQTIETTEIMTCADKTFEKYRLIRKKVTYPKKHGQKCDKPHDPHQDIHNENAIRIPSKEKHNTTGTLY